MGEVRRACGLAGPVINRAQDTFFIRVGRVTPATLTQCGLDWRRRLSCTWSRGKRGHNRHCRTTGESWPLADACYWSTHKRAQKLRLRPGLDRPATGDLCSRSRPSGCPFGRLVCLISTGPRRESKSPPRCRGRIRRSAAGRRTHRAGPGPPGDQQTAERVLAAEAAPLPPHTWIRSSPA